MTTRLQTTDYMRAAPAELAIYYFVVASSYLGGGILLTGLCVTRHFFSHTDLIKSRLNLESKNQQ